MLGPEASKTQWSASIKKYIDRAASIGGTRPLSISVYLYNCQAVSVLQYIGQFCTPPKSLTAFERKALHQVLHFATNSMTVASYLYLASVGGPVLSSAVCTCTYIYTYMYMYLCWGMFGRRHGFHIRATIANDGSNFDGFALWAKWDCSQDSTTPKTKKHKPQHRNIKTQAGPQMAIPEQLEIYDEIREQRGRSIDWTCVLAWVDTKEGNRGMEGVEYRRGKGGRRIRTNCGGGEASPSILHTRSSNNNWIGHPLPWNPKSTEDLHVLPHSLNQVRQIQLIMYRYHYLAALQLVWRQYL